MLLTFQPLDRTLDHVKDSSSVYGENRIPANEGVIIYPSVGAAPSSKNGWEFTNTRVSEAFGHKGC